MGRLVPVEAGALVPAEAGTLAPVEAGTLVPVEAVVLVPVSSGSQDFPHTAQAMDTATGRELPLLKCLSYVSPLRSWLPREARTTWPVTGWGLVNTRLMEPLSPGGGPSFPGKPGPKAAVARPCI